MHIILNWKCIRNKLSHVNFIKKEEKIRSIVQVQKLQECHTICLNFFFVSISSEIKQTSTSIASMCSLTSRTNWKFSKCNDYMKLMNSFVLCKSGINLVMYSEWNLKYFNKIQNKIFQLAFATIDLTILALPQSLYKMKKKRSLFQVSESWNKEKLKDF